ncbi:unnamed protein product [Sphagnum jensenii]|uniref:Cytochrome P450 n=1 Tax=Sphagnum jensenii TaxID=128206 RepID=A0ABP1AIL4_9BRYO
MVNWCIFVVVMAILQSLHSLINRVWWEPKKLQRIMEKQGWKGPPFRLFVGNMADVMRFREREMAKELSSIRDFAFTARLHPQYALFSSTYGDKSFFFQGDELRIFISDPHLVKEVLLNELGNYYRPEGSILQKIIPLVGRGLANLNGEEWVMHRRILDPAFRVETIKGMVGTMVIAAESMMETWEQRIKDRKGSIEIEVNEDMRIITADTISRTAFGSSYKKGQQVFEGINKLRSTFVEASNNPLFWMSGYRFLPTAINRKIAKLKWENDETIKHVIQSRKELAKLGKDAYGSDLLGLMLIAADEDHVKAANGTKHQLTTQDLVEECKHFFFGGYETMSSFLTWTMLMLAEYPEWQERARTEILKVCGPKNDMDASKLNQLKIVGMILNEVHRLFTSVLQISRVAKKDMQLGDNFVPKGLTIEIPLLHIHHDPRLWGEDAWQFNPNRFANGVSKACQHPQAFIPFSFGPRHCIGQHFGMMESKIVVASVLLRFQLSVSPNYKHSPTTLLGFIPSPKTGVQLIVENLKPNVF